MEMYTFYIKLEEKDDEQIEKTAGLLEALRQNYGVTTRLLVEVVTDKVFLVPMLEELGGKSQVKVAEAEKVAGKRVRREKAAAGEWEGKPCPECGATIGAASVMGFCSKRCYMMDYRRKRKEKKSKASQDEERRERESMRLPNQAQVDQKRVDELARIEAVVAKAKMNAPSADFIHTIKAGGSIMARKL